MKTETTPEEIAVLPGCFVSFELQIRKALGKNIEFF